jgi:two-component system phosphate regulon sensor histidine kinase PhoR
MIWPILFVISAVAGVWSQFYWRRRFAQEQQAHTKDCQEREQHLAEQRQKAEQAEAEQQALFNSMVEGLLVLDEQGRIQHANPALETLMEARGELRGRTVLEAFRLNPLSELVARVAQEGQVHGLEMDLPGLKKRSLQVNAAAILDEGKRHRGTLLVFHDLTRLKELENTRKEFVANVSHELRTPLSLIKGYVETLIDGAKDDPMVATKFLQTIEKHADRLTYLIEDLLTISQLESGQGALNLQNVELKSLVDRVFDDLADRAAERAIQMQNAVPDGILVHADADRLQQVLFNLIDNSIKYGRQSGKVVISAVPLPDEKVRVSVVDDGPGIPPDSLERIFERFFRVDRARSREQGGTGLGLSIVKHIVQSHGGEVWATSELGKGATFFFTLSAASGSPDNTG